jgi:hypothetical protein
MGSISRAGVSERSGCGSSGLENQRVFESIELLYWHEETSKPQRIMVMMIMGWL